MDIEVRENAASVVASPGDRVVIHVPENASTGYQWVVEELTAPLQVESSELATSRGLAPGEAVERVVKLRATERGEGRLVLVLNRAWERDTPPEDRFSVSVSVV
jgi:predicted secreted protein